MTYSTAVQDHFEHPRHVGVLDDADPAVGTGVAGTLSQGAVIRLQIRVNDQGLIADSRFKAYGCPATIAAGSLAAAWVRGRTLAQALAMGNPQIAEVLALPPLKIHCAVLAEEAVKAALADWRRKQGVVDGTVTY